MANGMVVKNNVPALNTLNTLNGNQSALAKSLSKISSGVKINNAQDDASGYAISERMRSYIRSLDQATQNTQNGSSLVKVAEGAVSKDVEILKTLRAKAIDAATDTNTDADRQTIQKEIDQFIDQLDDNALITFNGKYILDGSKTAKAEFAVPTSFTNQSLATDTTFDSEISSLYDRSGKSLEISSSDYLTASFVKDGQTFTTNYQVGTTKLSDIFSRLNGLATESGLHQVFADADKFLTDTTVGTNTAGHIVNTADRKNGLTVLGYMSDDEASSTGFYGQIAGISISISNSTGSVKKDVDAALNNFSTTIWAANVSDDHSLKVHVGADSNQSIAVGFADMRSRALGLKDSDANVISVSNLDKANAAIAAFNNALQKALDVQTTIGAIGARLEYTASNLTTSSENVQAAESTIRDADMAKEMTDYTKNNVLLQAAQSMLAQANQNSSAVLSLLQ